MALEQEDKEEIRSEVLQQLRRVILTAWSKANEAEDESARNIIRMYFLPAVDELARPYDVEELRKLEDKMKN